VIRCLITDGSYSLDPERWLKNAQRRIADGVELFQIRERDLGVRDLAALTRRVVGLPNPHGTKILVNDRADIAIACGAHGVHLRDHAPSPEKFAQPGFLVTAACHAIEDVNRLDGVNYVLLAPIFKPLSKTDQRPVLGLSAIRDWVGRTAIPVLALGGITRENARECINAGAAGIAGITYFEQ
jgi:thiamine-phosphate pyrophosphorylase